MKKSWKIRGGNFPLDQTAIMGILNLTPDSFSDGGQYLDPQKALSRAKEIISEGAHIIDLGAESTRPGAKPVSIAEELNRILPVLKNIRSCNEIIISIDTTKPEVAEACLREGAHIINDVSGLKDSGPKMAELVRSSGAGIVLMHRRGNPETMQEKAVYRDVVEDVLRELRESVRTALDAGILPDQIVVDPGIGFAKTAEQNVELIAQLEKFHDLGFPVLAGPSEKSFIGKITGRGPGERGWGTAAVVTAAVLKKIDIIRVHQIQAMKDVILVAETIRGAENVRAFKMGND